MQLSEIKNDLATINYSPEINRLMLGDFILIEDKNQSILAQIISIEATLEEDVNSAMLKFLLSIDKEANLTQYSGYVPAKNATLILINPDEVVQLIKGSDKNINLGNLAAYPDISVDLSLDFLRKKTYIQVDFVENKFQIVKTIINGLEKHNRKTLLFDFNGLYEGLSLPTVTVGYNFKLPLNYDALCYIAEEELNDFGNENKSIIQGILIEVQNYVKTVKEEFIPFDTLISVLDAQYDECPMSELLLLKNKLLKYQQQGLFAQEKSEFDFLDSFLKDAKNFKFDLSEVPSQWHKIAIISILNIINTKCYLIADFTDDNSNKTIIKKLYEKREIKPIIISSYNYKYQIQLKAMSKNLILFKPIQKVDDFAGYTSFLNILSQDTFIIWGEQTLYLPLILKLNNEKELKIDKISYIKMQSQDNLNEVIAEENNNHDNVDDGVSTDTNYENFIENEMTEIISDEVNNSVIGVNDVSEIGMQELITDDNIESDIQVQKNNYEDDIPNANDLDFFFDEKENIISETENNIDNLIEEEQQNLSYNMVPEQILSEKDEITEDISNDELETVNNDSATDEVINDFADEIINENILDEDISHDESNGYENTVINNDINLQQTSVIEEDSSIVELKQASVPVYNSNSAPQFDTKFAQGTYVHHPKYGRGIVEKVINYGSKELCLIIFDNEGRKLLDPNIAELKQI